jgi:SH3-like domain-containing protein
MVSDMNKIYLLLFLVFFMLTNTSYAEMLSIKGKKVNLRSGPGTNYDVKWEYGSGFPLKIISKKGDWYKVKDFENDTGWVSKSLLVKRPHMIVKVNKKKDKKINIRSGPGKKYRIVGKAYYGVVFQTLEQRAGWAKVKHETGLEGWIKRTLLWGF